MVSFVPIGMEEVEGFKLTSQENGFFQSYEMTNNMEVNCRTDTTPIGRKW